MSWHWLFFINVVPGIAVTRRGLVLIDFDKPDYSPAQPLRLDGACSRWPVSSARSNTCWRRGRATDWFDEDAILHAGGRCRSAVGRCSSSARVLTAKTPIVDLRAFTNRNFAVGSLFSFVLGIGLYGLTYLYPVYLAQIRGYNALMIGETHVRLRPRHVH